MKEFTIVYIKDEQPIEKYKMTSFLGSVLIEELYYAENEENAVLYLELYKDVFDILYKKQEFKYDDDKSIKHIVDGLKYFISDRLGELILCLKNDIYYEEKKKITEFFRRNRERVSSHRVVRNTSINFELIGQIRNPMIYLNPSIPMEFLKENVDNIVWYNLCSNPSIPLEFFKEHIDKIEKVWNNLCLNPSIPLEFFKEHLAKISWNNLCLNPSIPVEFFKEHFDKINNTFCWRSLCANPSIPVEFFKEHFDKINNTFCWRTLCANPSIPVEFFKENLDKIKSCGTFYVLCLNPSIPIEFFKEHLGKVSWTSLCNNTSIPLDFFKEHLDKIKEFDAWHNLCKNPSIPLEFFKEHKDQISWENLCQNPSIPLEFIEENKDTLTRHDWYFLSSNPLGIKQKIERTLKSIDPILIDKYIQTSYIVLYCLRLLENDENAELLQKLCINEYPLISNTILCSKERNENFYSQIKYFLCTLKEGNMYKDRLRELCKEEKKKEEKKQKEIKEDTFIINIYDLQSPIRKMNNLDTIQIFDNDRTITLIKENDIFHDIESLDYYTIYDIIRFQDLSARISKGEGYKEKQEIEEKQRITKDIENQKNMALHTIHERLQEEIPELTFKMFYEAYNNMYSHKNPLTFTEKEFNSLFHKVKRYIDIKKLDREKQLRELQREVKEVKEVKEEPLNTDIYNAVLLRDGSLTVNEFNRIYRLVVDSFNAEMTFNDRVNLIYNHIDEIRRAT